MFGTRLVVRTSRGCRRSRRGWVLGLMSWELWGRLGSKLHYLNVWDIMKKKCGNCLIDFGFQLGEGLGMAFVL